MKTTSITNDAPMTRVSVGYSSVERHAGTAFSVTLRGDAGEIQHIEAEGIGGTLSAIDGMRASAGTWIDVAVPNRLDRASHGTIVSALRSYEGRVARLGSTEVAIRRRW